MRLLLTADPYLPVPPTLYGGIERIVALLAAALRQRGHTVGLVAHRDSRIELDFIEAWPAVYPNNLREHATNTLALSRAVATFRPDVVHSFSRVAYMLPLFRSGTPLIMSYQRNISGRSVATASRLAGEQLVFTGCSAYIAEAGRRRGGQWYAIPNFVDPSAYRFRTAVGPDAPLVFLSRVESVKGADVAIAIAKRTGRKLVIAGNHSESGYEGQYWREQVEPEIGRNGVEYVGPVDDSAKANLLEYAAALVVPIRWNEPFGIVFAEALAAGVPVISSPRGALPEIVRQGTDGFLISSVEEGCDAVRRIHEIDRAECRRRAETCFAVDPIVSQYEMLYERCSSRAA